MLYKTINFQIIIVKFYYAKQILEIVWNKIILDNSEKEDKVKSSNESRARGLK